MSSEPDKDPFLRITWLDGPGGEGARWWNEAMAKTGAWAPRADDPARREVIAKVLMGAGLVAFGFFRYSGCSGGGDDGVVETLDAIDLQRRTSWDVGDDRRGLTVSDGWTKDVDDSDRWQAALASGHLAELFAPEGRLRPFYSPTLFQVPDHQAGRSIARYLTPIQNAAMDDAYARGRALAEMFEAAGRPTDTALVIDLPGPEAVALAAGLADLFAPVFMFDNWPHPRGVVPSHRTLDAALYYLPRFERVAAKRPWSAPPAFVLDANRLAHYRDAASDFDNRYVVSLPSRASLAELGVTHLMYVTERDPVQESDDLNGALAAYDVEGLAVRAVATADFQPDPEGAVVGRVAVPAPDAGVARSVSRRFHYGGGGYHAGGYHGGGHIAFWRDYGWYQASRPDGARPSKSAKSAPAPIPPASRASSYRPVARATMFANRAIGPGVVKPSWFGRITTRVPGSASSYGRGRSGSFGRGYSSYG